MLILACPLKSYGQTISVSDAEYRLASGLYGKREPLQVRGFRPYKYWQIIRVGFRTVTLTSTNPETHWCGDGWLIPIVGFPHRSTSLCR